MPVDAREVETLAAVLETLADERVRATMREAALRLVEQEHRVDRVADAYAAVLEEAAGGEAVEDGVLHEVASAAAEVGMGTDDAATLAARLREVGLGDH